MYNIEFTFGFLMKITLIWRVLSIFLILSLAVLIIENSWSIVIFSVTFIFGYGGMIFYFRKRIRSLFDGLNKMRFPVFIGFALLVSVLEELYVYSLGNKVAVSNIWLDIVIVPLEWAAWFATWYLLVSHKYSFTESQALLSAGLSGILFEYSGKGFLISDPLAMLVFFPTTVFVYAAIFILPMQLIPFTGKRDSKLKYPIGVFVPYISSLPVGLALYFSLIL